MDCLRLPKITCGAETREWKPCLCPKIVPHGEAGLRRAEEKRRAEVPNPVVTHVEAELPQRTERNLLERAVHREHAMKPVGKRDVHAGRIELPREKCRGRLPPSRRRPSRRVRPSATQSVSLLRELGLERELLDREPRSE